MVLKISYNEKGTNTPLIEFNLKTPKNFTDKPFANSQKEDGLPSTLEDTWINSWELAKTCDKIKSIFRNMLRNSTENFIERHQYDYKQINIDYNSNFQFDIIEEEYRIRDQYGNPTDKIEPKTIFTFHVNSANYSFNQANLTKNVSKDHTVYKSLFEQTVTPYYYDYVTYHGNNTHTIKGIKNTLLEIFSYKKFTNRFLNPQY